MYSGLSLELGRMWDCECMVVPIVISGLGVVSIWSLKNTRICYLLISLLSCVSKLRCLGVKSYSEASSLEDRSPSKD